MQGKYVFISVLLVIIAAGFSLWILYIQKKYKSTIEESKSELSSLIKESGDLISQKKYKSIIEESKSELSSLIKESGDLISELNRLSDHIFTQIDLKNKEIGEGIKKCEIRAEELNNGIRELRKEKDQFQSNIGKAIAQYMSTKYEINLNAGEVNGIQAPGTEEDLSEQINKRYKKIIQLAKSGFTESEIAKELDMGKGEIKLILKLCNNI